MHRRVLTGVFGNSVSLEGWNRVTYHGVSMPSAAMVAARPWSFCAKHNYVTGETLIGGGGAYMR